MVMYNYFQVFKQEGSVERYLFVKPGKLSWHVSPSFIDLKGKFLHSGSAGQSCPAHPSNSMMHNLARNINNWRFKTVSEGQDDKFEEGGVVLRCSVHDSLHGQWLFEQGRDGHMQKERVGALLCEEDKKGHFLLALSNIGVQTEVARWNKGATSKIAHMMSAGFVQWLISQANEGNWAKEDVGSIMCKKNAENQLIMATLDDETQKKVAVFNSLNGQYLGHKGLL